jgi:spermidine/putrescine transport system ATP-binding protein
LRKGGIVDMSQVLQTRPDQAATGEYDVELRSVTKRFGPVVAVDNVSLSVWRGEFFSLLGPSGCGKTTTLRMLGGFEFPDTGLVLIAGREMGLLPPYRRPTNMVFQQLALFPHMTVSGNIAFGLEMKKLPRSEIKEQVNQVMELVQLQGLGSRRMDQLSGGQQQRVAIARAIVNKPQVLLLDEPLGSLDLKLRLQMQIELKKLQREVNTTFVYVTHDQREAMTMSDRIGVMRDGLLVQVGTPSEIYERPVNRFVAHFIGDTNLLRGTVASVAGQAVKIVVGDNTFVSTNHSGGLGGGEEVWLSLRYEKVKLGEEAVSMRNVARATVVSSIYRGATVEYELTLGGGVGLRTEAMAGRAILSNMSEVEVGWDEQAGVVFRNE